MADKLEKLVFSLDEKWKRFADESPWAACILETAKNSEGQEFIRKRGTNVAYKKVGRDYRCVQCDSEIMGGTVAHSIWNFPLSGSGECHYETVPYCPKCEEKPNFSGEPICCY